MSSKQESRFELEEELAREDEYDRELRAKFARHLYVSNFLESSAQGRVSQVAGEMLSQPTTEQATASKSSRVLHRFKNNFLQVLVPFTSAVLVSTVTYPLAVRFVKRAFGFRNFYAIHCAIAPLLAFVNVHIVAITGTLVSIKVREELYKEIVAT